MKKSCWITFSGSVISPAGLIIGVASGYTAPVGWNAFSDANTRFLKGTDSDVLVGTVASASGIGYSSGSGGNHASGSARRVIRTGWYQGDGSGIAYSPSRNANSVSNHTSHSIGVTYTPARNELKLVIADGEQPFFEGALFFSDTDMSADHVNYTAFNNSGYLLRANTTTNSGARYVATGTTGSRSNSHIHTVGNTWKAYSIDSSSKYTSVGYGGGNHGHTNGVSTFTPSHKRALMRAWRMVDTSKVDGIIGMWAQPGLPEGWELVTSLTDNYLECSATGDGSVAGNNTVYAAGSTGSSSHAHGYGCCDSSFQADSDLHHSNGIGHTHSWGGTVGYEPSRYYIKFVRYVG